MLRQSFGKVMLVSHEQRSYAWKLTDSGVKSGYLIGWHAHFHGYRHLRRICGEAWRICRFRGSVWAFWLNHLKKILHCHWLIFSTDSQRELFVNTALVFTSECLLFRTFTITTVLLRAISTSDIWKHFRQCSVCDCGKRFGTSIQRLIRSLKRISMPHGRILLTSYWTAPSTTQAESSILARNFGAELLLEKDKACTAIR
jgi:hypothetical protein